MLYFLYFLVLLNTILALVTVFREPRDIAATWAWMLVLIFLPVIGFLLYSFAGRKLPKKRLFRYQAQDFNEIRKLIGQRLQQLAIRPNEQPIKNSRDNSLITLFNTLNQTYLAPDNHVRIFTNGPQLFEQLIKDLKAAKATINIEFYTFYSDKLGHQIRDILVEKARQGVKVHVVYDSLGSFGTSELFFRPLRLAGGYARPFLHTHSILFDFRLNFRDHRKIVVIDGQLGYIGGFNIGDQYMNRSRKFGYWRDTHLRISGPAVYQLQGQFILDWNATDIKNPIKATLAEYFPLVATDGNSNLQIVTSGPDSDEQQIKMGYIRLIQLAQRTCWIQTPYLIPDDSTYDALRIAASSGIDVRIMVPCMPDHPFVYRATQYYAHQLALAGVKVYYYRKGFIHAKTVVIDNKMASVGSANFDFRSFKLNFEINSFIYDKALAHKLGQIFEEDLKDATLESPADFAKQSWWLNFKQHFSRLLAPIL
ncbi:cardiolipin synthase [Convivina intestini]|uniref:Cardiolipin synthase n=1 Tax=Convivina intestini TaxID=1505726 RepID=A0A2U1D8Z9_9LACO|nr:cardiolipin synthase [Convivina intestini]PVY84150.1 cardiolipin synthase [Convivina intestini]CAH1854397.1 Major cardiolipin synthase ClsA [Convivina intestini]SDB91275.1 cardiolipin synthase [Leuconostocaceae bacterium R-53105]